MSPINITILILGGFVAIWLLFIVPAQKRIHKRKLNALQERIKQIEENEDSSKT